MKCLQHLRPLLPLLLCVGPMHAQSSASARVTLQTKHHDVHTPSAVLWLTPVDTTATMPNGGPYVLLQKNRTFSPHVLVVPVGAVVSFPNVDPFFHNVFSLFEGKRFDLGLYEKGSSKTVQFNRVGVSYLFCNIHPTMSAVVVALNTPYWSIADQSGRMQIDGLQPGEYNAHLWVEGESQDRLEKWTHRMTVHGGENDAGELSVTPDATPPTHTNKFGQPYPHEIAPY